MFGMSECKGVQQHEEQRPKNAGVHTDQNLRHHSKTQRRTVKQQLTELKTKGGDDNDESTNAVWRD